MNSEHFSKDKSKGRSENIYRRLLGLYPKAFRDQFGDSMAQLFREQREDVRRAAKPFGMMCFWLRIVGDLGSTVVREHISEVAHLMKTCLRSPVFWKSRLALAGVFTASVLLMMTAVVSVALSLPKVFRSTARIVVKQVDPLGPTTEAIQHFSSVQLMELIK